MDRQDDASAVDEPLPPPPPQPGSELPPPPPAAVGDNEHLPPPPVSPETSAEPPPRAAALPHDPVTPVEPTEESWDYLMQVIGAPFDAVDYLATTFAEARTQAVPLAALTGAINVHGLGLWLDHQQGPLAQERCRALVDNRIGWSDDDFRHLHELQFTWNSSGADVGHALVAFDQWLVEHGNGKRLVAVTTNADFYLSILHPQAGAIALIAALAACGLGATMQDGSLPAASVPPAPPPPTAGVPPAPQIASARVEPVIPQPGIRLPTTPSLAERLRQKREAEPPRTQEF